MKFGYQTITWGGVVGHPGGVTSIKDLFYMTHGDTKAAIRDIAQAGYQGAEVFDGNLAEFAGNPEDLLQVLAENNIELVSVYTGANFIYDDILDDELFKIEQAAHLAKQFGASRIVLGGGAKRPGGPQADDFKKVGRGLDMAADIARDNGLESSYHPHLGTISETLDGFHQIMDSCSIGFCPDTAHLTASGIDPVAAIALGLVELGVRVRRRLCLFPVCSTLQRVPLRGPCCDRLRRRLPGLGRSLVRISRHAHRSKSSASSYSLASASLACRSPATAARSHISTGRICNLAATPRATCSLTGVIA